MLLPKTQRYLERMYTDRRSETRPQSAGRREVDRVLADCYRVRASVYGTLADCIESVGCVLSTIESLSTRL